MKIAILGYKGFVGNVVYNYFINRVDYETIGIEKSNFYTEWPNHKEYGNIDILINCSGNPKKFLANANPSLDCKINIEILDKILSLNCIKIIHISSIDALNPKDIYGINKLWMEDILKQIFKDKLTIIRLGGLVGKNLKKNIIYDIVNNLKIWSSGDSVYNFIDIEVLPIIIEKYIESNEHESIFNFASSKNISVDEISKLLSTNVLFGDKKEVYNEIPIDYIKKFTNIESSEYYIKKFIKENDNL